MKGNGGEARGGPNWKTGTRARLHAGWLSLVLLICVVWVGSAVAEEQSSSPSALPDAQDVAEGIAQAEEEASEAQEERETPGALEQREESQTEYADASVEEAAQILHSIFAEEFETLNSDPARALSDAKLMRVLEGGMAAVLREDGSSMLLDAGVPVIARDGVEMEKVDLSLVGGNDGYETDNPLVTVSLPEVADGTIEVGDRGLTIEPVGASGDSEGTLFGDKNVLYHDADVDTDLLVSPIGGGVEIFDQLRSTDSPEELRFSLGMPDGATLLPDGSGGAQVDRNGVTLARVPFPTAVDAQGADVPVEMEIEGNSLVLHVPHRTGEYAYPILVDPTLAEDWYNCSWYNNCNLQGLNAWVWGDSGHGWIYPGTTCFWTCWGSGRGLYIGASSGKHGPGEFGQWSYTPPGGSSYVTSGLLNPFWRNNYANCPKTMYPQPHDYAGLWSAQYGWLPNEVDRANDYGNAAPSGYGRVLIFGLGMGAQEQENKCRRDIMVAGAAVWVTDPDVPTWTIAPSAPDQWTDTTVVPVSGAAVDGGLGTKYFNLYKSPNQGTGNDFIGNAERPCSGLKASPCEGAWSGQVTNYNPAGLPNGVNFLVMFAYDALGIEHRSQGLPVRVSVDHSAPEIAFSGELFAAEPKTYKGKVTLTDGNSSSLATAQSGMKSAKFYLDGVQISQYPESANPAACVKVQEGVNTASCKFELNVELKRTINGQHVFKAVGTDSLNHVTEKSVTLNLPKDQTAPSLTLSGPLKTAAGLWLTGGEPSLTLDALDVETGVVEERIFVDGTQVGATLTQECFAGGCGMKRTVNVALDGYAAGPHTIKAVAKDGAGNQIESSWKVSLDKANPELTSLSSPDLPTNWNQQVASFTLDYSASDSHSGIKKVEVTKPVVGGSQTVAAYSSACTGSSESPCQASVQGSTSVSTTNMAQGAGVVTVKAYDASGRVSSAKSVTVLVDRSGPTLTVGGQLMNGPKSKPVGIASTVTAAIKDFGGGVESLEILIDGEVSELLSTEDMVEEGATYSCTGETCELRFTFNPPVGELQKPGLHTIQMVARDKTGQTASLSHEATLDTRAPEVNLSGALAEAAGETLPTQSANLSIAGKDEGEFSSGIERVEVEVDGKTVLRQNGSPGSSPPTRVWVADAANNRIQELDENGAPLRVFGLPGSTGAQLSRPTAVAVDQAGDLWVADTDNNLVKQFTQQGKLISQFGGAGLANGKLNKPEGIAIDASGNVWVADSGNGRLQKFGQEGNHLKTMGFGILGKPVGIAIDPTGLIWASDYTDGRVEAFSDSSGYLKGFGTPGTEAGQLLHPGAIAIANGVVWVTDLDNGRLQGFAPSGEALAVLGQPGSGNGQLSLGSPSGVAFTPSGTAFVADSGNGRVQKWLNATYDLSAGLTYSSSFGTAGTEAGQFKRPADIARGANGWLWVVDQGNNRVQVFGPDGEIVGAVGSPGSGIGQLNRPNEIAIDQAGNVYVADALNKRLTKFGPGGQAMMAQGFLGISFGMMKGPEGVAIDSYGNFWVVDPVAGKLLKYNPAGGPLGSWGSIGSAPGQFGKPTSVAIGPDNLVAVADWQNNRISMFDETGAFVRQFGIPGTGDGQFQRPISVSFDKRGYLWVTDELNGRIQAFTKTGEFIAKFGPQGLFNFQTVGGIENDPEGNMWVADSGNNQVQKLALPTYAPKFSTAIGSPGYPQGQFQDPGGVALAPLNHCEIPGCPAQASASYTYHQATWGSGPHTVTVTVTDGAGNVSVEEVRVNEPLAAVAPQCPTAQPTVLSGGQTLGQTAAISGIEATVPEALEASEAEASLDPSVTREFAGVSLNEMGIDVTESVMGGGIEDQAAGAFTVGQAACLQPLQVGSAASPPAVIEGSAVVYPNAAPDTDTVIRPTASGTAIVERLRGAAAPTKFSWAIALEPGEELVKLANGSIAVVVPAGEDFDPAELPPPPETGPDTLNDTGVQLEQADHDLLAANDAVTGEVTLVIATPEVLAASGAIVPGILRITSANVVTAELPPGTVAETEAMIIRTSPPAEPESICASVLARTPEHAWRVCGGEEQEEGSEDGGDPLGLQSLAESSDLALNAEVNKGIKQFEADAYGGLATASSGSSGIVTEQQKRFCRRGHSAECREFTFDGLMASIAEELLFTVPSDGTQANAFRHTYWVALMRLDSPEATGHYYDGLAWSLAHEEDQWKAKQRSTRFGSRMDILNNYVGWLRAGTTDHQACEIMLRKAALNSIFLGAKRDPFVWRKNNDYQYYRPVYRKFRDNIGPDSSGDLVYANGNTCDDVGF